MNNLRIEPSKSSPEIDFDASSGLLRVKGESFPENAAKFYAPVMEWILGFFAEDSGVPIVFELEIVYFNSSTSKVLMNLFRLAEKSSEAGRRVSVRWICDAENETAIECGEEFKEDLSSLSFEIVLVSGG